MVNTNGAFFNTAPSGDGSIHGRMPNAEGGQSSFSFANMAAFQAFILLHELGHQMKVFGEDLDAATNGVYR